MCAVGLNNLIKVGLSGLRVSKSSAEKAGDISKNVAKEAEGFSGMA
jgi:hypothetical protein